MDTFAGMTVFIENLKKWTKLAYERINLLEEKNTSLSCLTFERNTMLIILATIKEKKLNQFVSKAINLITKFELNQENLNAFKNLVDNLHVEFISICILNSISYNTSIAGFYESLVTVSKTIQDICNLNKSISFVEFQQERLFKFV